MLAVLLFNLALGVLLPHWVIAFDRRRLRGARLRRAYPPATHWCSIVTFSWLAVWVHFVRTRRSVASVFLGLAWGLAGFFVQAAVATLSGALFSAA